MRLKGALVAAAALALATPPSPTAAGQAAGAGPLRVVQFDFDGGGGTLFVTPDRRALLVDTGWEAGADRPGRTGDRRSDARRIADRLERLGVRRIDVVLTTHYHGDHVGGLAELAGLVPIGLFADHGDNRELPPADATAEQRSRSAAGLYDRYLRVVRGGRRRVVRPGDRIALGELVVDVVAADGAVLPRPLAGGGVGVGCDAPVPPRRGGEENARSVGVVARFGRARAVLLGDATRDVERRLVCPRDLIGAVDLVIATHHGSAASNDPALYATLRPRVVVIPNGARKGGDPSTHDAIAASPALRAVWQSHESERPGSRNAPADRIANLAGAPDEDHPILIAVERDGALVVTNARTGASHRYRR